MISESRQGRLDLGANIRSNGSVSFKVWAPRCTQVDVRLLKEGHDELVEMQRLDGGYFEAVVKGASAGTRYFYVLNKERERPDPVSRFQPLGVHGPSEIVDPDAFRWTDSKWKGRPLEELVIYELHMGTFTPEGTFDSAVSKLAYLNKLGITCVEVMPIAQFPGERNWGYDGVGLFAPQNTYGGPEGFKRFVNACHGKGLAVCLDVVYNHLGPEGNYLQDFGPFFTGKYNTPWGDAVNYDDMGSDKVRKWMVSNGLYWLSEYHVDALRVDAIHAIHDSSAVHFLTQFNGKMQRFAKKMKRKVVMIAESDLNDTKVLKSISKGGLGFDAQWADDFHHAVHAQLTGETQSYYQDYSGLKDVSRALSNPFLYEGQHSEFRQRRYGSSALGFGGASFVTCTQNHDQVGNRARGDRLNVTLSFELQKATAVLQLIHLYTPLLWMGQEYGEKAPFQYFVDHSDDRLIEAVREGRKREFISVQPELIPVPDDAKTFADSKLRWDYLEQEEPQFLLELYRDLLALRKKVKLRRNARSRVRVAYDETHQWLAVEYPAEGSKTIACLFAFSKKETGIAWPFKKKYFTTLLRTDQKKYGGAAALSKKKISVEAILMNPESAWIGSLSV